MGCGRRAGCVQPRPSAVALLVGRESFSQRRSLAPVVRLGRYRLTFDSTEGRVSGPNATPKARRPSMRTTVLALLFAALPALTASAQTTAPTADNSVRSAQGSHSHLQRPHRLHLWRRRRGGRFAAGQPRCRGDHVSHKDPPQQPGDAAQNFHPSAPIGRSSLSFSVGRSASNPHDAVRHPATFAFLAFVLSASRFWLCKTLQVRAEPTLPIAEIEQ